MSSHHSEFLIIGGGIFGLSTALELASRGHKVRLFNQGGLPDPQSASADISKVVRMEYGSDLEYMQMAALAIEKWREWNTEFNTTLYHECGFLIMSPHDLADERSSFERNSLKNLQQLGYKPDMLTELEIHSRFEAFQDSDYQHGFYHKIGGYAEASKTLRVLAQEATRRGVILHEDEPVKAILTQEGRFQAVRTSSGKYLGAELIVCAGNFTPYLLPELAPYFKITGHPVFHVKPSQPELFTVPKCAVFAADTSNSGWYGFPLHPHEGVVKIGLHSNGKSLDPTTDLREVSEDHHRLFKSFLKEQLPSLAQDPIVYTRLCCYTDTLDGHYWIDRHPDVKGLTVASGGSGHGFKMGPIIGGIIADVSLTGNHAWSKRYQWRELGPDTTPNEEARFIIQ